LIFFIDLKSLSPKSALFFYVKLLSKYLKLSFGVFELMNDFYYLSVFLIGFYSSNEENPFKGNDYLLD
jgi:hypothetical protein